jgi:hypothetical protein
MKLRYKLIAIAVFLGAIFMWGRHSKSAVQSPKAPVVLPKNDVEQIVVNPANHTLTVINTSGHKTVTLPDRASTIDVLKNGQIKVTSKQFGFEHHPFVYTGYSDALRFGIGLDGVYWKRLDLGLGVAGASRYNTVVFAQLSYNFWSNVRIGLTYDHTQHIGASISVRL